MQIMESLSTSVFGLGIVFAVLAVLILIISLQSRLAALLAARKHIRTRDVADSAVKADMLPAAPTGSDKPGELKLIGVDERTAAMIMAIVCEEIGIAPDELIFKSIKAVEE